MLNLTKNNNVFSMLKNKLNYYKRYIIDNKFWLYTLIILQLKSFLFLAVISSNSLNTFDFIKFPFYSVSLLVYLSFSLVLLGTVFLFKGKTQYRLLIFINLLTSIIIIADLWHYRGFQSFISPHLLSETTNLNNLWDAIISMFRFVDIVFLLDFIIIFVKRKNILSKYKQCSRNIFLSIFFVFISLLFIFATHYKLDIIEKGRNRALFKRWWTPNQTMAQLSPIGYHIYDTYIFFKESKTLVLNNKEQKEIKQWFENKKENLPDNKYKGLLKGKNLIFIQVESMENFVLQKTINNQEITPNINKLLNNSIYFSKIHEQVNMGTSSDSDLMVNTSIYPVRSGSTFFRYPANTYKSMPKLLEQLGYSTLAAHPDKGAYWNWMPALKSIGFQKCIDSTQFNIDESIGLGLSDGSYLKQLASIILKQKQPFYTFFVTLTSHGPFNLPNKYRELKLDENLDKTKLGGYFQSLNYTDKHIGLFLNKLKEEGVLKDTVVVIFGDHTGVHKYYKDELEKITPKEDWWLKDNLQIPFIIYNEDLTPEVRDTLGGQIDILPTVAYLMGIDEKEYLTNTIGRNLLKTNKNFVILNNGTYLGETKNDSEKNKAIEGLDIADKLIRSNYFKNYNK